MNIIERAESAQVVANDVPAFQPVFLSRMDFQFVHRLFFEDVRGWATIYELRRLLGALVDNYAVTLFDGDLFVDNLGNVGVLDVVVEGFFGAGSCTGKVELHFDASGDRVMLRRPVASEEVLRRRT